MIDLASPTLAITSSVFTVLSPCSFFLLPYIGSLPPVAGIRVSGAFHRIWAPSDPQISLDLLERVCRSFPSRLPQLIALESDCASSG